MTAPQTSTGSSAPEVTTPGRDRPVRVYLLDDHALMRRGIREVLEGAGGFEVVGESATGQDAVRRIPAAQPDVVLADVKLPDGSGVDVCRRVRAIDPSIGVLMVTTYDDEDARQAALRAGASGFVLKEVDVEDLVRDVARVANGEVIEPFAEPADGEGAGSGEDGADARFERLTPQERRVLALVAEGLTNREIGEALGISPKTAKNHVASVLLKLGVQWRTQAAVYLARTLGV